MPNSLPKRCLTEKSPIEAMTFLEPEYYLVTRKVSNFVRYLSGALYFQSIEWLLEHWKGRYSLPGHCRQWQGKRNLSHTVSGMNVWHTFRTLRT